MSNAYFVALLSDPERFYGKHAVEWVPFGADHNKASEFAKGKGLQGKDAPIHIQYDNEPPPSQKEACAHEMRDYGHADRIYHEQGEYWAEYTCIHCVDKFTLHAGPMMGR